MLFRPDLKRHYPSRRMPRRRHRHRHRHHRVTTSTHDTNCGACGGTLGALPTWTKLKTLAPCLSSRALQQALARALALEQPGDCFRPCATNTLCVASFPYAPPTVFFAAGMLAEEQGQWQRAIEAYSHAAQQAMDSECLSSTGRAQDGLPRRQSTAANFAPSPQQLQDASFFHVAVCSLWEAARLTQTTPAASFTAAATLQTRAWRMLEELADMREFQPAVAMVLSSLQHGMPGLCPPDPQRHEAWLCRALTKTQQPQRALDEALAACPPHQQRSILRHVLAARQQKLRNPSHHRNPSGASRNRAAVYVDLAHAALHGAQDAATSFQFLELAVLRHGCDRASRELLFMFLHSHRRSRPAAWTTRRLFQLAEPAFAAGCIVSLTLMTRYMLFEAPERHAGSKCQQQWVKERGRAMLQQVSKYFPKTAQHWSGLLNTKEPN